MINSDRLLSCINTSGGKEMDGCDEKEKYHYKIYIHIHPTRNYSDG